MEALLSLLIVSIALVTFYGVTGRALKVTAKAEDGLRALLQTEHLLFELENGLGMDLVAYGGERSFQKEKGSVVIRSEIVKKTDDPNKKGPRSYCLELETKNTPSVRISSKIFLLEKPP